MKILGFLFLAVILFGSDLSFSSSLKARSRLAEVSKKLNLTITEDELASLIDHFHQQNLDQQRGWKKLLHIEKNAFGFESSQITDPNFFLAQNDLSYLFFIIF